MGASRSCSKSPTRRGASAGPSSGSSPRTRCRTTISEGWRWTTANPSRCCSFRRTGAAATCSTSRPRSSPASPRAIRSRALLPAMQAVSIPAVTLWSCCPTCLAWTAASSPACGHGSRRAALCWWRSVPTRRWLAEPRSAATAWNSPYPRSGAAIPSRSPVPRTGRTRWQMPPKDCAR